MHLGALCDVGHFCTPTLRRRAQRRLNHMRNRAQRDCRTQQCIDSGSHERSKMCWKVAFLRKQMHFRLA